MCKEYTDIKGITHNVAHVMALNNDTDSKKCLVKELFNVLTRPGKPGRRTSA